MGLAVVTSKMEAQPRPPPIEQSNVSGVSDDLFAAPGRYSQPQPRFRFAAIDDVVMLRLVNAKQPWTAKKTMVAWEAIAAALAKIDEFGVVDKKGAAVKSRFELLKKTFKADELESLKKSGVDEEFEEREQLLTDIVSRIEAYEEGCAKEREFQKQKMTGIEASGLVCRSLAMQSLQEQRLVYFSIHIYNNF